MTSSFTPRRSLARPRPSLNNGINTVSTPNLASSYSTLPSPAGANASRVAATGAVARKASLSALTSGSLATIPDASEGYGLNTVLDDFSPTSRRMAPHTPAGRYDSEIESGDLVDVPGGMYGTVKFVGAVQGKKGTFAGVELSEEFATRGKNSGDVDG